MHNSTYHKRHTQLGLSSVMFDVRSIL